MLTEAQLQQFQDVGYVILEAMFAPEQMDELAEHIDRLVEAKEAMIAEAGGAQGISRAKEIVFAEHLAEQNDAVKAFIGQPKLVGLAVDTLGPNVSLYWDQAVYKRPETKKDFPWHQDNGYVPIVPEQYLTLWIAVADATLENGCIWVIPGSHKQGVVKHVSTPIGQQCYFGEDPGTPVPLKKGSLVAFSSMLFHRSGPNVSDTIRKGYVVQYSDAAARHGITHEPFERLMVAKDGKPVLNVEF